MLYCVPNELLIYMIMFIPIFSTWLVRIHGRPVGKGNSDTLFLK